MSNQNITYHVQQTSEVFDSAISRLESSILELNRLKEQMISQNDLTYVSQAVNEISNIPQACRLDLFVTRPLRAFGV